MGVGGGSWICPRPGRHAKTLSREPRHGWHCKGYEKSIRITMAARPNVAAAELAYMEIIFPDTLEPKDRYPVNATRRYNPTAVPIDVAITPFISFSSRISFAIVKISRQLFQREGIYILMTGECKYYYR